MGGSNQVTVALLEGGSHLDYRKLLVNNQGYLLTAISGTMTGTFTPSGLTTGYKVTIRNIDDTGPQAIPLAPYAVRNTFSARVLGVNPVYIVESTNTSISGTETPPASGNFINAGYPKFQYEEIAADVKGNAAVEVYVRCAPGQTSQVAIWEIA